MTTAVSEVTAITDAAVSANRPIFETWWAFAEGKAAGFTFVALAFAIIAGNEARTPLRVLPSWVSWIGMLAPLASFAGWALGVWIGIPFGNLLWLVSSLLMCLWIFWFGLGLMSKRETQPV